MRALAVSLEMHDFNIVWGCCYGEREEACGMIGGGNGPGMDTNGPRF